MTTPLTPMTGGGMNSLKLAELSMAGSSTEEFRSPLSEIVILGGGGGIASGTGSGPSVISCNNGEGCPGRNDITYEHITV